MNNQIKPRVIVHNSTAPFVEHYIDVQSLRAGLFSAHPGTDDELFHMVAKSIVKRGTPYWEVDLASLDAAYDPATRDAWVIDPAALGEPSGYGENDNV
jgi:hypothetical protein